MTRFIACALLLLVGIVAVSAMRGLTYPYGKNVGCENPACHCLDCVCTDCPCGKTPVDLVVALHPVIVADGIDARFAAEIGELKRAGWYATILQTRTDQDAIRELILAGPTQPYVVFTGNGKPISAASLNTAKDIGEWLNSEVGKFTIKVAWKTGATIVPAGDAPEEETAAPQATPAKLYSLVCRSGGDRCPPCKHFERDQRSIEGELETTIRLVHDDDPARSDFPCNSVPTFFLLLDGKIVDKTAGYGGKKDFLRWLNSAAKANGGHW